MYSNICNIKEQVGGVTTCFVKSPPIILRLQQSPAYSKLCDWNVHRSIFTTLIWYLCIQLHSIFRAGSRANTHVVVSTSRTPSALHTLTSHVIGLLSWWRHSKWTAAQWLGTKLPTGCPQGSLVWLQVTERTVSGWPVAFSNIKSLTLRNKAQCSN